jgi:hypothetical protein
MEKSRRPGADPNAESEFERESRYEEEEGEPAAGSRSPQHQYRTATDEPVFEEEPEGSEPVFPSVPADDPYPQSASRLQKPDRADGPHEETADGYQYRPFADDDYSLRSPKTRRQMGRTGPFWLIGGVLLAAVVITVFFVTGGMDIVGESREQGEPQGVAGQPGGAALPAETVMPTSTPLPPTPTPVSVLRIGQEVQIGNTEGQGIRLRADAGLAAITQAIYNDGRIFVVLEPGSGFSGYPVEKDGHEWYRIRVADDPDDQLVGWTVRTYLIPTDIID